MINHSCKPNSAKLTFGTTASFVFAIRNIAKDEEITVSYFGEGEFSYLYRSRTFLEQHWIVLPGEDGEKRFPAFLR